jgi:hypothetical protein
MTNRKDVSLLHNLWNDAQRVDKSDLNLEQDRSIGTEAAMLQNHIGSGVLLESPTQNIIFNSDNLTAAQASILAAGNFDGQGLDPHQQPTDSNLGNQLEVELSGSTGVVGRFSTKVAIIGVAFDDTLIIDRFYFYKNEKQVTANHYKSVLAVFFNDFKGNNNCSRTLGGSIIIREASSFQLSRDPIMVAHDVEPDIFWRDWKVADPALSLFATIQNGIGPSYSVDALNINTTERNNRLLPANDVVKRIGQKFLATTDNIQKVTLLLGVQQNDLATEAEIFDWSGDIVVSVYALQTTTGCPTDIVPGLAIEFDPSSEPISQLSFDQAALEEIGYVLTNVPQPVDFVFSSTKLGSGSTSGITPGNFYAVTIGRAGAATAGTLFLPSGNDNLEDSRLTVFTGVWTDVVEEDLWFQIWTDAAKIANGQGYDNGIGMQYDKTATDPDTGGTIDNQITDQSFTDTGEKNLNVGVLQASEESSVTEQDERTGNNVFSRKKFVPEFNFLSESGLAELRENTDPIVIGCAEDINPKDNPDLEKTQTIPGLAKGDKFIVVNPDADLLSLNLVGSKLIPNNTCIQENYLIVKIELCTDGYGDVNGDGYYDSSDVARASALIGESLQLEITQQKIVDGEITTLELLRADVDGDGYVTSTDVDLITQFVNKQITTFPAGATFQHMVITVQNTVGRYDGYFDCDGYIRLDGYTGHNIVSPDSLTEAQKKFFGNYSTPSIDGADPAWNTVPFADIIYEINALPYWQPHFVVFNSDARVVPSSFCSLTGSLPSIDCDASPANELSCVDQNDITPLCDPGTNTFFVPGDLIIGRGQIKRPDGNLFRGDYEVGTVILELPEQALEEVSLNMFDKLVADRGDGVTRGGYPAMKYADCTTVQDEDLSLNRVRFSVSVQAFVPNLDGYDVVDGYGVIVDDIIGVYVDQTTGILQLSIKDLFADQVLKTLVTKIQIDVLLKKSGWVNTPLTVSPAELPGLLS